MTRYTGYMVEVDWDGSTVVARGTNRGSHFALMGRNDKDKAANGDLVLRVADISDLTFKGANPLVNGTLSLTSRGRTYQMHFRRKSNDEFTELAAAIEGARMRGDLAAAGRMPPPATAPAGWYTHGDVQRYWDGTVWTDHVAPLIDGGTQ